MRHVLVNYNEIALKGKNRRFFEEKLVSALRLALSGLGFRKVKRLQGRILIEFREDVPWEETRSRLARVFGVSHFAPARPVPLDVDSLRAAVAEEIDAAPRAGIRSFAVETRRAYKGFPLTSMEINRDLGKFVQEKTGWRVSIDGPDLPIYVYVLPEEIFFAFDRQGGAGGLPAGVAGKVACLISGGIDSPVAAHRLMRRGSTVEYIHFHSFPFTSAASVQKALEIVACLQKHRGGARVHLLALAEIQRKIVAHCPPAYRVLLYRRFMMRAAEAIARREGALALATGESLGQVASQTLENLAAIEAAVSMPVLRPLVGFDKIEIVNEARRIGTFAISTVPHDDCCGYLMPPNPATRARAEDLDEAELVLDVAAEVEALVGAAGVVEIGKSGEIPVTPLGAGVDTGVESRPACAPGTSPGTERGG